MPKIKVDHVISFSSEDPVHVAGNILNPDPAKKWKCKEPGERSATVVLQLERASVINAIDIGNENSAYVEVLVTRSGTSDDYKVLLVMSSFMTPFEARQTSNINKVRMFTQEQLSKPENQQKWDRVKIVCTQPFNRHVQYGLSFIALHTPSDKPNAAPVQATIGKFALRPSSPDTLSVGSLFARRIETKEENKPSAAQAIREASASTMPVTKPKIKINTSKTITRRGEDTTPQKQPPRNRNEILYSKDEEEPHKKIDTIIEKTKKSKEAKVCEESPKRATPKRRSDASSSSPKKKRKVEDNKPTKPFNELLKGVVLVISGIQNPDRGNLRGMALSMGAKYKPDWDSTCTHLVCAFAHTPKFNQVRGKGKIVRRNWIEECLSQRKRLPWRRFCLDNRDKDKNESEDEIWEEIKEDQNESTDDEGYDDTKMQKRIEELQAKQRQSEGENSDVFTQDTEVEEDDLSGGEKDSLPNNLPDFLTGKRIFIDEKLDEDVSKMLERYIIAYKGIVAEEPSSDVDICLTSDVNASNLKKAHKKGIFVSPDWLWDCHNNQSFVSIDAYLL